MKTDTLPLQEYSSQELRDIAQEAPTHETLQENLIDTVEKDIERQIAEVQLEAKQTIDDAVSKIPLVREHMHAYAPMKPMREIAEEICEGLAGLEADVQKNAVFVIESLRKLQEYRVAQVMKWIEQLKSPHHS